MNNLDDSHEAQTEPIVLIPFNPVIELDDTQGKTDEEVSLVSEKKSNNLPPTRSPSLAWQYYKKVTDDKDVLVNVKCIFCGQKYGAKTSTGTLNDHYKRKHFKIQPGGAGSIEVAFSNSQTHSKSHGDYSDILNNLINWVIMDCQAFRVVDSSFKRFMTSLNPGFQVPSRQFLRKKIDTRYEQSKKTILNIFQVNFILIY
jgi:hypothetical protein